MQIFEFLRNYTEQIGGQFTDYDHTKAITVMPLPNGRFQTVLVAIMESSKSGKSRAIFSSKVGELPATTDTRHLLEEMTKLDYSRFILDGSQLNVEASITLDVTNEDEVKLIIQEVATVADEFEMKFTGKDIH
jgi:excinuclease UvrABC ATPase subunit